MCSPLNHTRQVEQATPVCGSLEVYSKPCLNHAPRKASNSRHSIGVSVVIPTRNEAEHIPRLLTLLREQSHLPLEVIVADNRSDDGTVEAAAFLGAKVIGGGLPAQGRNNGARLAKGKYLLFLDADTAVPRTLIENLLSTAIDSQRGVVGCRLFPSDGKVTHRLLYCLCWHYFLLTFALGYGHAWGAALLVKSAVFHQLGGFRADLCWGEDLDFANRSRRVGQLALSQRATACTSARRFAGEGTIRLACKYVVLELQRIVLGEVRHAYFPYFAD